MLVGETIFYMVLRCTAHTLYYSALQGLSLYNNNVSDFVRFKREGSAKRFPSILQKAEFVG